MIQKRAIKNGTSIEEEKQKHNHETFARKRKERQRRNVTTSSTSLLYDDIDDPTNNDAPNQLQGRPADMNVGTRLGSQIIRLLN